MPRLWAKTVSFDSVSPGDELPILVKWETEETIQRFSETASSEEPAPGAQTESDVPKAQTALIWGAALTAYIAELLEKGFKLPDIVARGSRLELEILRAVNPGDTLVLFGSVVDKREEEGLRLVDCRVTVENQSGDTVATAIATVSL